MKNKVPFNKAECCGCGVCSAICPKSAISMKPDEEGFLFPVIDEARCIDCGICIKNCSFYNRKTSHDNIERPCYILRHKKLNTRMHSRSGGVFVCCSDEILQQGGSVYGAVMEGVKCLHLRATDKDIRNKMCYSKYIQSDTVHVWDSVKSDLLANYKVLFSGTPCQIDALYSYLRKSKIDITNLYTMDLICHGVPSPKLFAEFIEYIENEYGGVITDFQFRDKTICGWDDHIESFNVNGKKYPSSKWRDIYYSNAINRLSCSNCKYASMERPGDITFGDAWGIRREAPELYDNRGASVIIINTPKGQELLEVAIPSCDIRKASIHGMMQPNLRKASLPQINRERLWMDYEKGGIEFLIRKYGTMSFAARFLKKCKYCLRKIKYAFKDVYLPGFYPLNH